MATDVYALVNKVSSYAQAMAGHRSQGMTSARAVCNVITVACLSSPDRLSFAKVIGNVLCNIVNWPAEIKFLQKGIAEPPAGRYFVPFDNSGFCRRLRDTANSNEGNLPHHMLSYFVMAHFLPAAEVYVAVQMHEQDTLDAQGSNPSMAGDLASGVLGVKLANRTYNLPGFPEIFASFTDMTRCGHAECG